MTIEEENLMFCPNCGTDLPKGSGFCSKCGYSISGAAPAGEVKKEAEPVLSIEILKRAFGVIAKKPFLLWGLSLLSVLLATLATTFSAAAPIIGLAIALVLDLGMKWVFLDGYRGKEINSKQLFEPFHNFWPSLAGIGWMALWEFLWFMIPFAGLVFVFIKAYSYSLTPYLLREKKATPQDSLKKSMELTKGYKGKMFLTDVVVFAAIFVAGLLLFLLSLIPFVGVVFGFILVLFGIAVGIFLPLLCGLINAAWFEEITKK